MAVIKTQEIWPRQAAGTADDVPSNAPTIIGVVGAMMGLSTISVMLRIYVRGVMIKTFGIDDGVIVLAFVS